MSSNLRRRLTSSHTERPSPNTNETSDFGREMQASLDRVQASLSADNIPSTAQVLEDDLPSPAADQDHIDRIIEGGSPASSSVSPGNDPGSRRNGARALRTSVTNADQPSSPLPTLSTPVPSISPPARPSSSHSRLHSFFSSLSLSIRAPLRRNSSTSSTRRPSNTLFLAWLTLEERISFVKIRTQLLGEMTEEHLDQMWRQYPELKTHPFYCSPRRLLRYGWVEPDAEEVAMARTQATVYTREEAEMMEQRPEHTRITVEYMKLQEDLANYQIRFHEHDGAEEPVVQ
ncbi:hypothetical protein MMC30_005413 [Trapelia coarctata]|nr:hypothetical protein [Trapelia coarctata]